MTRIAFLGCAFSVLLLVSVGCGGDGGNGVIESPPANVAGVWSGVANNAGSAIFAGCTGDLVSLDGLTVAGVSSGTTCASSGPLVMTQSGAYLTALPVTYSCDNGNYGSKAGGGTVTGQSLSAQLDSLSTYYGVTESHFYTGTVVAANTIALLETRFTAAGNFSGSCNISPNLSITITIYQPLQWEKTAPQEAPDALPFGRMLVAHRGRSLP